MKQTTIAHIILEKLKGTKNEFKFPLDIKDNLQAEHDWALSHPEGPQIMHNHKDLFYETCDEIDKGIADGILTFSVEDGIITYL